MFSNIKLRIFLTSFLILFLELSLIRYLTGEVAYFGYYSNFILLASFVGIGLGMLLVKNRLDFSPWFFQILLVLIFISSAFSISIIPDTTGEIHFSSSFSSIIIPEMMFIPIIFIITALSFIPLAQILGKLFHELSPLEAYTWDIFGSLFGIASFSLFSYFAVGPFVWFAIIGIGYLLLTRRTLSRKIFISAVILNVIILTIVCAATKETYWSPYQKLQTRTECKKILPTDDTCVEEITVFANNVAHQSVVANNKNKEWIYDFPYHAFKNQNFSRALVIGAGTGNDVAVAIRNNVKSIDAVEIDPQILELGRKIHPDAPYSNPIVNTFNTDARSFLEKTDNKYDIIIFALPDSLVLSSSKSTLRLESFLFTMESFRQAKARLNKNGILVLYNYYRTPWLFDKLSLMLEGVFGRSSYAYSTGASYLGIIMNGDKLDDLRPDLPPSKPITQSVMAATDDWPYLYLLQPSLPFRYLIVFTVIVMLLYIILNKILDKAVLSSIEPTYFLLGVAFMLVETKSIAQFSLLFGSTWIVNSMVFTAILISVLAAIQFVSKMKNGNINHWYLALGLALLLQYIFPLQSLLGLSMTAKYLIASTLAFLPIFLANVIFSLYFKDSKDNSLNFASNLLGAAIGGALEYSAMLVGYRNLTLVVLCVYILAFTWPYLRMKLSKKHSIASS